MSYKSSHKTKKLSVVIVGPSLKAKGGISKSIDNLFNADLTKNYNIKHIASFDDANKLVKLFIFLKALAVFNFLLLFNKPDLVHIHSASNASFYRKAIFASLARLFAVKYVFHIHGGGFEKFYKEKIATRIMVKQALDHASLILVLTSSWGPRISKMTNNSYIYVLPNSVKKSDIEFNKKKEYLNILFLGRINQMKGAYDLLEIAPKIIESYPSAKFVFAGDGEIEKFTQLCQKMNLSTNYIKVTGWLDGKQKEKALKDASLLVLPSYFEGQSLSVLEAMAFGLPVVVTRVGGNPDVVKDGVNGFLVDAGDKKALFDKIIQLLNDEALRNKMGKNNVVLIEKNYTSSVIAQKLMDYYDLVVKNEI